MTIITEPLEKALATLKEAWHEYQKDISNTFVRDSVTQRFEYTYELSHKTLRRFLAESESSRAEVMELMYNDLIRLANKRGLLLNNLETWDKYRKARNLISHNHYEFNAKEIMIIIPVFIEEVETELNVIKEKLCSNTMNAVKIYV
jgi:nucleotidyltransferase substrate binding protein (TIGR01987 family)